MIARHRRLRASEVAAVLQNGKSVPGSVVSAKIAAAEGATIRVAAVVSKKLAKKAPLRNRLRRALYRSFDSLEKKSAPPRSGAHVVLFLRRIPDEPITTALMHALEPVLSSLLTHP